MRDFTCLIISVAVFLLAIILLCGESLLGDTRVEEAWVARYDGPARQSGSPTAVAVDGTGNTYVLGTAAVSSIPISNPRSLSTPTCRTNSVE